MNLKRTPEAVVAAAAFAASQRARFTFICVGAPQQELIAYAMRQRGDATGVGLCVGAALDFLAGKAQRAPVWMRAAGLEVSLYRGALPEADSASLAAQLLGKLTTASRAAVRAENQLLVQGALNAMEPIDREVLTLRHFEMLSNEETAQVLGLSKSAASNRYVRALRRLKEILSAIPGLIEG